MRLLKICFTEAPPQFLPEAKRFARVKDSSRFSALCDLPETIESIFEKFRKKFLNFLFFFKKKMFFAVSSWARMVFETYAYPFGYFRRCKIDEISMSFYPWFSPYDIAYLVFFKSSQVFAKHGFASVFKISPTMTKKIKGETLWDYQHPFCRKTPKK